MVWTLAGYYEAQDGNGALHNIAAIPDQTLNIQGDAIRIPEGLDRLIGHAVLSAADVALIDAILESPTLRKIFNINIGVLINALVFGKPPEAMMHTMNPTPMSAEESLELLINSNADSSLGEYGLVWLGDGEQPPVKGLIHSIRATAAIALVAGTWVNGGITFSQKLPPGKFRIVGMRAQGTNLVASRIVVPGFAWRPGVAAVNVLGDEDLAIFRMGRMGVFAEFDQTVGFTIDCLGASDSAQDLIFDLIYLGP